MKTPAETASPLPDLTYQNIMTGRRSTHSPMPIHLGSDGVSIYDCSGFLVAKASLKEVAPGIVQACNSFPALYAALEGLLPLLDKAFEYDGDVFGTMHNTAVDAVATAVSALALAQGEKGGEVK